MNFIKKYLPELAVVLAMVGLLLWAAVQTWRLEAAHNQTDRVTLAFEQYKLQQQAQMQQERQRELELKEVERYENEQRLQQIMVERDGAVAERDGVRAELARVRQAAGGSAAGNCTAAAHTIRVLTELLEESDRLAGVYAQYADTTRNHLLTCNGFYNARLHEE
jgi:type II secretory pathway pseudopilin PulG